MTKLPLLALLALSATALADPGERVTAPDAKTLDARILDKAKHICGDPEQAVELYARKGIKECIAKTVADAHARLAHAKN